MTEIKEMNNEELEYNVVKMINLRWGYDGGGMACGPVEGNTLVELCVTAEDHRNYFILFSRMGEGQLRQLSCPDRGFLQFIDDLFLVRQREFQGLLVHGGGRQSGAVDHLHQFFFRYFSRVVVSAVTAVFDDQFL